MGYIFDAAVILIFIITIVVYYRRGFVRSIMGFARLVLAFVAAWSFGGVLGKFIAERFMNGKLTDIVYNKLAGLYEAGTTTFDLSKLAEKIPESLANIAERCGVNIDALLASNTNTAADVEGLRRVAAGIAQPISGFICSILGFIIVFFVAFLLLMLLSLIAEWVVKLPLLRGIDRLLGGLVGVLCGFINVMLVIAAVNILALLLGANGAGSIIVEGTGQSFLFGFFSNLSLFS